MDRRHLDRRNMDRCGMELGAMRPELVTTETVDTSRSPQDKTALLAGSVLVPSLLVLTLLIDEPLYSGRGLWALGLITLGFVVSEPLVFHLEARNEAVSMSPTEIPLAIGLLLLSPLSLVAARIIGSGLSLLIWRRPPLFKLLLNLTAFTAEAVIAMIVFRSLFDPQSIASPAMWLGLVGSLFIGLIAGGITIATAISFFENNFGSLVRREFRYSCFFYLPGAVLGASLAVPMLIEPWLLAVFGLPAPVMWLMLRSYGRLMHRFADLSQIHEFSSQVSRTAHIQEMADTAVREIATHLRAERVSLTIWDNEAGSAQATHGQMVFGVVPSHYDPGVLARLQLNDPAAVDTATSNDPLSARLRESGIKHALVVVLEDDGAPIGLLVVADRMGASNRFDIDDRNRLRSISEQLAIVVRKAQMHQQIQYDATHDRLTALPNRSHFEAWTNQVVNDPATTTDALFMLDLDRFKEVNDTLGHATGDLLLQQVADRLQSCLADSDLAARFGGDEFAIIVPGAGAHEAELLAERISGALERPFMLGETSVAIGASIGIAVTPLHGDDPETLIRCADLAMYDAKKRHSRSSVYHSDQDSANSVRLAMLGDLRDAVNTRTLAVHFQPKTDIRTDVVVAVEALARWDSPVHGVVGPEVFIPLAEQAGLIGELTELVLDKSLREVRHWGEMGHEIGVAVNLSPQSLLNEDLPNIIRAKLQSTGVPPHLLTIEITEQSVLGDSPRAFRIIDQVHGLGVKFSIDDFGTGHSSLVNLRRLPISELKIDRSFVEDMLVEHADEVIVKSTIDLGHNLGFDVVAEGVETPRIRERLQALGCDIVQGFGICRPLSVDHLDRWLKTVETRQNTVDWQSDTKHFGPIPPRTGITLPH